VHYPRPNCASRHVQPLRRRAMCNLYAPNNFASPLGDANGDGEGYVFISRTRHLRMPEKVIESP